MRAIAIALAAGFLTGGAVYAHGTLTPAQAQRSAGTLSCTTKPELSLVFGATPVADCTFVSDRGSRQSYVAMFHRATQKQVSDAAETVTWRVVTKDGADRPGMLSGTFTAPTGDAAAVLAPSDAPELMGQKASLKLVAHSGQAGASFSMSYPRIALVSNTSGVTH